MSIPVLTNYGEDTIVSSSIFEQLPDYVKSNYENFAAFLQAYYEWLEDTNNVLYHSKNIRNYKDIDKTMLEFVQYFESEFLNNIPTKLFTNGTDVSVNKATLIKNIRQFYRSRGSERSYKLLFRILFNENVEFYYPKVDMLYASDGKWAYNRVLRVTSNTDIFSYIGKKITGVTSGATAAVENVIVITIDSVEIGELYLNSIIGEFQIGETVSDGTTNSVIYSTLNSVVINSPGSGYVVGERIVVTGDGDGAELEIEEVKGPISSTLTLLDPGFGYEKPPKITIIGTGFGAKAHATLEPVGISRVEILNGGSGFTDATPPVVTFSSEVGSTAPSAAAVVVDGQVTAIEIINPGSGFTTPPTVTLDDSANGNAGQNCVTQVYLLPTSIKELIVDDTGRDYSSDGGVTVNFEDTLVSSESSFSAIATGQINGGINKVKIVNPGYNYSTIPSLSFALTSGTGASIDVTLGSLFIYPGQWLNTDGFISSDKYLQDSFYYQVFSYVLKSTQSTSSYRDVVKKVLHPAGLILFGLVQITDNVEIGPTYRTLERNKFYYPPYDEDGERLGYNTTFPVPNSTYWNGYANTQISQWLDKIIGSVTGDSLVRTNLTPEPYFRIYNPVLTIPEDSIVQYDMIEGADPQILYDIVPSPTYNGTFGNISTTDTYDPVWSSYGVQFNGTYVNCSSVPVNPFDTTVVVVFRINNFLSQAPSLIGCIDVDKDSYGTGYSITVGLDGSVNFRVQKRGVNGITYNLVANYPAGTITTGTFYYVTLRHTGDILVGNINNSAPVSATYPFNPVSIGVVNNSTGWYIGNQGFIPPISGPSYFGSIAFGSNMYASPGSYTITYTYEDTLYDVDLFNENFFDGETNTNIEITSPLPGNPILDGIISYVIIYERYLTDSEISNVYETLKVDLLPRSITLP